MKLTRAEALAAKQLIPQSDLDAARIAIDSANADLAAGVALVADEKANIDQARAAVKQAQINLERTVIESPINGIVISRSVDVGQTVASAYQAPVLFSIAADLERMQVEVDIDESDIGGIQPGEPAQFRVESYPNEVFTGKVQAVRLQPVAEQTTTTATNATIAASPGTLAAGSVIGYATIIEVANPGEKLRPGMTATVTLNGSKVDNTVRIPNNALSFRPPAQLLGAATGAAAATPEGSSADLARVWLYNGTQFTPLDVHVGLADGQWTQLQSGPLKPGDAVVTGISTK
jgi:HlyD family secretion protein